MSEGHFQCVHKIRFSELFQINKGSSQIRAAIPYLTDQIRAKISLALIYSGVALI